MERRGGPYRGIRSGNGFPGSSPHERSAPNPTGSLRTVSPIRRFSTASVCLTGLRGKPYDGAGRRDLPVPLPSAVQPGVDKDIVDFYTGFFSDWVTTSPVDKRWLPAISAARGQKPDNALVDALVGWRLRDHGAYLAGEGLPRSTAHSSSPARNRASFQVFTSLNDAVLPLIVEGEKPSPVLPFLIFALPRSSDGNLRAVALVKLLDSPYDTLGIVSEKRNGIGWKVTGWVSSADY